MTTLSADAAAAATVFDAFTKGEILQVLFFSILFGFALMSLGDRGHNVSAFVDDAAHAVGSLPSRLSMK